MLGRAASKRGMATLFAVHAMYVFLIWMKSCKIVLPPLKKMG